APAFWSQQATLARGGTPIPLTFPSIRSLGLLSESATLTFDDCADLSGYLGGRSCSLHHWQVAAFWRKHLPKLLGSGLDVVVNRETPIRSRCKVGRCLAVVLRISE